MKALSLSEVSNIPIGIELETEGNKSKRPEYSGGGGDRLLLSEGDVLDAECRGSGFIGLKGCVDEVRVDF